MNFEELKVAYDGMSIPELAAEVKRVKVALDDAASRKSALQKHYDFLTMTIVPERMDDEGIETLKIKDVGRLQMASDIRCSCPAANRKQLEEWMRNNGHVAMITSTVNSSTLKAFVKEQMKENGNYPSDLLKVEPFSRATVVKA